MLGIREERKDELTKKFKAILAGLLNILLEGNKGEIYVYNRNNSLTTIYSG